MENQKYLVQMYKLLIKFNFKLAFFLILIFSYFFLTITNAENNHKIVLLVNEEIITSYDILQRMKITSIVMQVEINDVNSLKIQNQIVDELVDEKIQNEKLKEYGITVSSEDIDDYELSYFKQTDTTKEAVYNALNVNKINTEIFRNMIAVQIGWNRLVSGLYYRLISVSDMEIEEIINLDSSISKESAYDIVRDRQISIKANKYLRDLKTASTIEYR